jgi:hypothetical protein
MAGFFRKLLSYRHQRIFIFAIDDYIGKQEKLSVDDQVSPDLGSELGVDIVQERAEPEGRILIVGTDNDDVTLEQIMEIFRRHGVRARLLRQEEYENE